MGIEDVDWSQNCMTMGVHNGRDENAFRMSLAKFSVSDGAIYKMVEDAIKHDAQQFVDHAGYTQEFADLICELWKPYFDKALKNARENATRYERELEKIEADYGQARVESYILRRNRETNSSWNDHVTYICRVCGTNASREAASKLEAEGKSIKPEYFRVTLSAEQHRTIEQAIRDLRAGDPESDAENEALLKAFLETTEAVE